MPNATETAAKAARAKVGLARALRQRNNEKSVGFFTIGIVGMIFLFMVFHWTRYAFQTYESNRGRVTALRGPVAIARKARSFLIRKVPGFTSAGHALIFLGWFTTCVLALCITIDQKILNNWAKRLGWIATSNLALVTFLALKNTPLAYLTSYSYDRINALHQLAGYGFIFWAVIHGIVYVNSFHQDGTLEDMLQQPQIAAIVAGFSILIILATALFLRKRQYEAFYIIHVTFFIVVVMMARIHRPDFTKKTVIVTLFTIAMWLADRLLRFFKISYFSFGNKATITPLAHGGTRIVLRKSAKLALPGAHAFLWIPAIRPAQTHPFTIVSSNPLEFVIASYDGFTRDLHAYAKKNPGIALTASIDGPYGCVPDFTAFNKVLLIAGGSGASFTFGVAVDLVRKLGDSKNTTIDFVWAVREEERTTWFSKELEKLRSSPLVNVSIHATRYSQASLGSYTYSLPDPEKTALPKSEAVLISPVPADGDIEKNLTTSQSSQSSPHIKAGRPEVASIIEEAVHRAERNDRIAVAACGPKSMMQIARSTVAGCIEGDGPSVELFLEEFGW